MWYVTFHGGGSQGNGGDSPVNQVYGIQDDGTLIKDRNGNFVPMLAQVPADITLSELRGLGFGPDGRLYVVDGSKNENRILAFAAAANPDGSRNFAGKFASHKHVEGMVHPFAFAFSPGGDCYVSSQDTNVVTALAGPSSTTTNPGQPLAVASYLSGIPGSTFLPGTFVASSSGSLPVYQTKATDVPLPQGLDYSLDKESKHPKVANSVRGIVFIGSDLYVADEPANVVKVYDTTGKLKVQIGGALLKKPVHLLVSGGLLYIGSSGTGSLLSHDTTTGDLVTVAQGITTISGIAVGGDGGLYMGDRKDHSILKLEPSAKQPIPFVSKLPDSPEFLLYLPD
jgi:hypothetical protein